jgi:hypothetical protein
MPNWNGPQPGPLLLRDLILVNFPLVKKIGIYNNRTVAGSTRLSHHAEGRALDIYLHAHTAPQKVLGDLLFAAFIELAEDVGADQVIWNRQIWSTQRPTLRRYGGVSPHEDHIHVGFTKDGSQFRTFGLLPARLAQIRTDLEAGRTQAATTA